MAIFEMYLQATGNNLNAGSTSADAASVTSTNGNWSTVTNIFTPAGGGTPFSGVVAGEYASIYLDAATSAVYVAKIDTVNSGGATITLSTTVKYGTAPVTGATGRSCKIGGAWASLAVATSLFPSGTLPQATRVNVKAATYTNTTTARNVTTNGTATAPWWWRGYASTPGDLDADFTTAGPIFSFTTAIMTFSGDHVTVSNIDVLATANTGNALVISANTAWLDRVRSENQNAGATSRALGNSTTTNVYTRCHFKATSTAGEVVTATGAAIFVDCAFEGGGSAVNGVSGLVMINCAFNNNGTHGVLHNAASSLIVYGCTFYSPGTDGLRLSLLPGAASQRIIMRNIFSECGGWGINNASGADTDVLPRLQNDFYLNTSGTETGFGDHPSLSQLAEVADPFTNASGGDLSLKISAVAKGGAGGLFENQSYTSYLDAGAVQRLEAGASGSRIFSEGLNVIPVPQSTTRRVMLKLYLTSTTTAATGKTAAVTLSKAGAAFGNPSAGATNATELSSGWYYVDLSTTDTGTLGDLIVKASATGCDDAERMLGVVKATNAGWTALPDAAANANGGVPVLSSSATTLAYTISTLTTYTGNTPQTGDSYAVVNSGTFGNSALKTLIDTVDDFLDTEIASIKSKTDNLPLDPASAGTITGQFAGVNTSLNIIDDFIDTEVAAIKLVTDHLATALVLDGAVYQFTANALELAPTGGGGGTVDANVISINGTTFAGDNVPSVLADGVAHGGTPGSSTATLAIQSVRVVNPAGNAVVVQATGGHALYVNATGGYGAYIYSNDAGGVLIGSGASSGYALTVTGDNAGAISVSSWDAEAVLLTSTFWNTAGGDVVKIVGSAGNVATAAGGVKVVAGAGGDSLTLLAGDGSDATGLVVMGGGTSGPAVKMSTTDGHCLLVSASGSDRHGLFVTGGTGGTSDGVKFVAGTGGVPIRGNITGNITGNLSGTIGGLTAAALADFFDTNSGTTYASAVNGSVVKEIATNAGGGGGTVDANIVSVNSATFTGDNVPSVLADGVPHGGTPGSSTATLALKKFNVTAPTGQGYAVRFASNDDYALNLQSTASTGLFIDCTDADGVVISAGGIGMDISSGTAQGIRVSSPVQGIQILSGGNAFESSMPFNCAFGPDTLGSFFNTDSTFDYVESVAGSVVKEIADNSSGGGGGGTVDANIVSVNGTTFTGPGVPSDRIAFSGTLGDQSAGDVTHVVLPTGPSANGVLVRARLRITSGSGQYQERSIFSWDGTGKVAGLDSSLLGASQQAGDTFSVLYDNSYTLDDSGLVNSTAYVFGFSPQALAQLFTLDTTKTFADAVDGSVVKEISTNVSIVGGVPTAEEVADTTLRRATANVEVSADGDVLSLGSLYGLIQMAQEASVVGTTMTIKQTDGTTTLGTRTLIVSAGANPITGIS